MTAVLYRLDEREPAVDGEVYVATNAIVIGDVSLGRQSSVWFNAVIRGDNDPIRIGARTNIQDGCVVHSDPGYPVAIGEGVTVGHMAMLHGCAIGDGTLVGINAVVMNGARIGRQCIIGSNALVTEGKEIPDRSLVVGSPGRVVREVTDDEVRFVQDSADVYARKGDRYRRGLAEATGD